MAREWRSSLFSCFDDFTVCLLSYIFPCYVFGKNAESFGQNCWLCSIAWCIPVVNYWAAVYVRTQIRKQKGIAGSCSNDACCVLCCPFCVLVQSAKEVQGTPVGLYMAHE